MKQFKDTKVAKILKERWAGKDMETYFIEKNKEFITRLKTEVKTEVKKISMRNLNLVYQDLSDVKYRISRFPDGQQTVDLEGLYNIDDSFTIHSRLSSFRDLELILCATQALKGLGVKDITLHVPYFIGARSDRRFAEGGVNYLKEVICPIINSQNYSQVVVMDPHSDVLEACLNNFRKISNSLLVKHALTKIDNKDDAQLRTMIVSPDAGALKKIYDVAKEFDIERVVTAGKVRDIKTGKIVKTQLPETDFTGIEQIVIIDDICDGGRTFIELAKVIREAGYKGKIFLIVTHGIFSAGFELINRYFDGVYVTNSYSDIPSYVDDVQESKDSSKITQLNLFKH